MSTLKGRKLYMVMIFSHSTKINYSYVLHWVCYPCFTVDTAPSVIRQLLFTVFLFIFQKLCSIYKYLSNQQLIMLYIMVTGYFQYLYNSLSKVPNLQIFSRLGVSNFLKMLIETNSDISEALFQVFLDSATDLFSKTLFHLCTL